MRFYHKHLLIDLIYSHFREKLMEEMISMKRLIICLLVSKLFHLESLELLHRKVSVFHKWMKSSTVLPCLLTFETTLDNCSPTSCTYSLPNISYVFLLPSFDNLRHCLRIDYFVVHIFINQMT